MSEAKNDCSCGCGVKVYGKWKRGHRNRIYKISKREDVRLKISQKLLGKIKGKKLNEHVSFAQKFFVVMEQESIVQETVLTIVLYLKKLVKGLATRIVEFQRQMNGKLRCQNREKGKVSGKSRLTGIPIVKNKNGKKSFTNFISVYSIE